MDIENYFSDDSKLVELVQNGDLSAYEKIVKKHQNTIALQMRRFSRDQHDIEDLTQQVFINAFTSINKYIPDAPFINWLRTIASRTGYAYWRENSRKPKFVTIEEWDGAGTDEKNTDSKAEKAELELEVLLMNLKPNERHIISLIYLDNKNIEEASQITGWSKSKIKMLAYRGRKKLKKLIAESKRTKKNG